MESTARLNYVDEDLGFVDEELLRWEGFGLFSGVNCATPSRFTGFSESRQRISEWMDD